MSRDVRVYLLDILERCERITRYVEGLERGRCARAAVTAVLLARPGQL